MLIDQLTTFSDQQVVTTTAVSTNALDIETVLQPSEENEIPLYVQVTEDFAGLTDLTVEVQTDDNPDFSSVTTVGASRTYTAAELKAGTRINLPFLPLELEKYARLNYNVTGTATAGKISSGLVIGYQTNV